MEADLVRLVDEITGRSSDTGLDMHIVVPDNSTDR
jgi:hypothetical protein